MDLRIDSKKRNQNEETNNDTKEYVNQQCDNRIDSPTTSNRNNEDIRIETFPCEMCGKKFSFKCDLYNHEKIHKGENPNKCEFCDHIARRGKHLKKHVMAMHYNQDRYKRNKDLYIRKSYKCGTCDKEFQYETQLRTHERTHIEQSYNCDLCGRKFRFFRNLQMHKKVHKNN